MRGWWAAGAALPAAAALLLTAAPRAGAGSPAPSPAATTEVSAATGMRLLDERIVFADGPAPRTKPPALHFAAGILVDIDTRTVLWSQNPHLALPEASTTKVMTALVALENFDPATVITVPPEAAAEQGDETVMGVAAGQQFSLTELLEGMLLPSGNDAANTIAAGTVGVDRFVATMNAQERALGLSDSTFVSPVGLDDPEHRASPYDLAAIALADVEHFPVFSQIVAARQLKIPATPSHPAFTLWNLNPLFDVYPRAVGIKPGYTGDSGPCLISMAVRDGHRLIAVLLDGGYPARSSRALLDWGFQQEGLPSDYPSPSPSPSPHASPH